MFSALRDRSLPLLEVKEAMTRLSGRLSGDLQRGINKELLIYQQRMRSMLARFPYQKIQRLLDVTAAPMSLSEREMFYLHTAGLHELCKKYSEDIRGLLKSVIRSILVKFITVEKYFQSKTFEKNVKDIMLKVGDLSQTLDMILSHRNLENKTKVITQVLMLISKTDAEMIAELEDELQTIASMRFSSAALVARQVLITAHQPSYERRHNQIESIFLSAIDSYSNQLVFPEKLHQLVVSETAIFDVLPEFFFHQNVIVRYSALEVYLQRAYTAYMIESIGSLEGLEGLTAKAAIEFEFSLPCNHQSRQNSSTLLTGLQENRDSFPDLGAITGYESDKNLSELVRFDRTGLMVVYDTLKDFKENLAEVLACFGYNLDSNDNHYDSDDVSDPYGARSPPGAGYTDVPSSDSYQFFVGGSRAERNPGPAVHTLNIFLRSKKGGEEDTELEEHFARFCTENHRDFRMACIRRVTFCVHKNGHMPKYFTYRSRDEYKEDEIYRHLEPALAFQLELSRLRNFSLKLIQTRNHRMHLYHGVAKTKEDKSATDQRFFVRAIIRHSDLVTQEASFLYLRSEGERLLIESLDELEVAIKSFHSSTDQNHVFLNFAPSVNMEVMAVLNSIRDVVVKYGRRLWELRVTQAELKINVKTDEEISSFRIFLSSENGYRLDTHLYREVVHSQKTIFRTIGEDPGPLNGLSTDTAYTTKDLLQTARYKAQSAGCAYVYDYPSLFHEAMKQSWDERGMKPPANVLSCVELILNSKDGTLTEVTREPAQNTIGMIAWRMKLHQPEFDEVREVIIIANDSTLEQGSFGPKEDKLFAAASQLARREGIPRIYITGNNSGARIGLCKDLQACFQVAWADKEAGLLDYVYLTPADYAKYSSLLMAEHMVVGDESRYKITAILGSDDCGTAALRGSGLIAGETSAAYHSIPTISLVTGRAVGIGAYLVRLGQRVIQVESSFIILTGFRPLNSVLGTNVYSSNQQLGGPQIMARNGVSHLTVTDDYTGVRAVLHWLSYIPGNLSILNVPKHLTHDSPDRLVTAEITTKVYDARTILAGSSSTLGILDRGSLLELQPDWAKTVFVGRGRLGGIPIGIISAETRTVQCEIPADPADRDSQEKVIQQAGQVWFPDSAFKTAQAIRDIDHEGLPLLILANWRGFSGGMKDMYDQVLKFGSMIVDALSQYKAGPILVYIPPLGELRGGAWAVLDPSINPAKIEIYADPRSRSSVLEPEGTVQVASLK